MHWANPMVQTVIMGIINIAFTLGRVFTVEKWGRKPLLNRLHRHIGALRVAAVNLFELHPLVSVVCIMVYPLRSCSRGSHLLGAHRRDIPQHHPWRRHGYRRGLPVGIQLHRVVDLRAHTHNLWRRSAWATAHHMFAYALYGVICVVAAWFVYKLVPGDQGKTLEEMSALWPEARRQSARLPPIVPWPPR